MDDALTRAPETVPLPNSLDALWLPFTANRQFKKAPRLLVRAEGMYYWTHDGRRLIDGIAGLWCVNAGHCRPKIVQAVQDQVAQMDYATAFQMSHPKAFEVASRLAALAPGDLDHVFFANSGSEGVDTALKMALAYHRARGEGHRTRFIGREKGYHGVGFGGISVGGIGPNRKMFGALLPAVDHLPHTHNLAEMAYSRGQPAWGAHLADELERIVALHDPSTIAAVIVEPFAGSAGVLVPPVGYLERLRQICDKHGLLLIFDEVITGYGRTGTPFGAETFGVLPDMMVTAKAVTNGTVPMGAVFVRAGIHDAMMTGPEHVIEFLHGYTYSGHPLACAAADAALDVYLEEGLLSRAQTIGPVWEDAIHSLKGEPHVIDLRNIGLAAAVEVEPRPGAPMTRAYDLFLKCYEMGVLTRQTGDILALTPPLIIEETHIGEIVDTIRTALRQVD